MIVAYSGKLLFSVVLLLTIFLGGCGGLPEYGLPHISQGDKLPLNVVTYRDLTISDFKARSVPERLRDHAKKLNAHTAVSIRPVPGTKYTISTTHIHHQLIYCGRVANLAFEAVMIPGHSWWNPVMETKREEYVLQHEQIHFALMEVAARQLTRRAALDSELLTVYESSFELAKDQLLAIYNKWLDDSRTDVLKEHTAFDQDTSMFYDPKVQQRWYDKVAMELNSLADWD